MDSAVRDRGRKVTRRPLSMAPVVSCGGTDRRVREQWIREQELACPWTRAPRHMGSAVRDRGRKVMRGPLSMAPVVSCGGTDRHVREQWIRKQELACPWTRTHRHMDSAVRDRGRKVMRRPLSMASPGNFCGGTDRRVR